MTLSESYFESDPAKILLVKNTLLTESYSSYYYPQKESLHEDSLVRVKLKLENINFLSRILRWEGIIAVESSWY